MSNQAVLVLFSLGRLIKHLIKVALQLVMKFPPFGRELSINLK